MLWRKGVLGPNRPALGLPTKLALPESSRAAWNRATAPPTAAPDLDHIEPKTMNPTSQSGCGKHQTRSDGRVGNPK